MVNIQIGEIWEIHDDINYIEDESCHRVIVNKIDYNEFGFGYNVIYVTNLDGQIRRWSEEQFIDIYTKVE